MSHLAIAGQVAGRRSEGRRCASGFTDGAVARRWGSVASNLDRFVRGEALDNIVAQT